MNRSLLIFTITLLFHSYLSAQPNTVSRIYNGTSTGGGISWIQSIAPTADHQYMLAGGPCLTKVDSAGNIQWTKMFWDTGWHSYPLVILNHIIPTKDSCLVAVGNIGPNPTSVFCMKVSSHGDTVWSKKISMTKGASAYHVQQTYDGGYILTGLISNEQSIFITRLSPAGQMIWTAEVTNPDNSYKTAYAVKQTPDSGFVVAGMTTNFPPLDAGGFLLKVSPGGGILWAKKYRLPATRQYWLFDVQVTNDGLLCMGDADNHVAFLKTDFSGNIQWTKTYSSYGGGYVINHQKHRLMKTSDGAYIFAHNGPGITKMDSAGNILWARGFSLIPTAVVESKNGYVICGNGEYSECGFITTDSIGRSQQCVYQEVVSLLADTVAASPITFSTIGSGTQSNVYHAIVPITTTNTSGCIVTSRGMKETTANKHLTMYPNPSTGIFHFSRDEAVPAQIIIYNFLGQKVYEAENTEREFDLDLAGQSDGIYFYKILKAGQTIHSGKLILKD